jgi:hypothetical protein
MELDDLQFADGFWHADNAPIYSRRKRSLLEGQKLSELKVNDLFYANLWGGEFETQCYLMKVIHQRPKDGCFDCLWLTKKRKLLRNIVGQAMFSEVPLDLRVFQQKKRTATAITTGGTEKKQKLSEETTLTTETLTGPTETEPKEPKEPKEPTEPTEPTDETTTPKRKPFPKFPQLLVDEKDKKDYSVICSKKLFCLPPKTTLHI